ncbi:uncharacterized protein BP5553_04233 [Venustampulla echinocandica]|uniref:Uncharacterized protein n=1 Tax=Venustampulla echinocandica TaxID=2656787 RepID=A0A370TWJ0_9HELO|nr:uncharacterized protein BP5553_04233 [Venustampulla echinocandica]RDL39893.1 hypothetical protein BP5553_04233 [Venustampulla echinocandica]
MPRPFPLPICVGTDICHIPRIRRIILKNNGSSVKRFSRRILAEQEFARHWTRIETPIKAWRELGGHPCKDALLLGDASGDRDVGRDVKLNNAFKSPIKQRTAGQIETEIWKTAGFLAGRFAAKEAVIKAHHSRRLTYRDIDIIRRTPSSAGITASQPPVALVRGESGDWTKDGQLLPISISHDGDYATATCISYEPHLGGGVVEVPEHVRGEQIGD